MQIPKIEMEVKRSDGVDFFEAYRMAREKGKTLLSNAQADAILQDENFRKKYAAMFPCWTGTIGIYKSAGEPFGEFIKTDECIFDVPKEFRGKKDCILVMEHPDY